MNPDSARNPGKNCPVVVSKILACEKQMFLLAHCCWVTFREEERLLPSDRNSTLMTQKLSRIRSEALIGRRSSFIIFAIVYEWQTKDKRPQRRNERRWISDKIVNIWVFWSSFADEHSTLPKSTRRNVNIEQMFTWEPHDYRIYYVSTDLRLQYGISVAESQTFLLAKRPSAAMSEEKRLPSAGYRIPENFACGIWNTRLGNPEYSRRKPESNQRLQSRIQVPLSKTGMRFLESGIYGMESRI